MSAKLFLRTVFTTGVLAVVGTDATFAQSENPQPTPICEQIKGVPSRRSRLNLVAKKAGAEIPQEVLFRGSGPLFIAVQRTESTLPAKARIEIGRREGTEGDFAVACDSGWFETTKIVTLRSPGEQGPGTWRLRVFDEASGGPTGEHPYVLEVTIEAPIPEGGERLRAFGEFPTDKPFSGKRTEPTAACGTTSAPLRPGATLEAARQLTGENILPETPWVWFVPAGRYLYVRIDTATAPRVQVRLYAKEAGGLAYRGICQTLVDLPAGGSPMLVYGAADWERVQSPVWRIEILPIAKDGEASPATVRATALRHADPAMYPPGGYWSTNEKSWQQESIFFQCREWMSQSERQAQAVPREMRSRLLPRTSALVLSMPGSSQPEVDLVLRALRLSVGLWIINCSQCNFDTLSMIRVDDKVWLRSDMMDPVFGHTGPETGASQLQVERRLASVRTAVGGDELFVELPLADAKVVAICGLQDSLIDGAVGRVKAALKCPAPSVRSDDIVTHLSLAVQTDRDTACGTGPNIIACEADSELLELNGRDYRFCLGDAENSCVGKGLRRLDLVQVMAHEVGHWLGLPHVPDADAIMGESMDTSRCISNADLMMLRNVLFGVSAPAPVEKTPRAFRLTSKRR